MRNTDKLENIAGGCLCGAVRFEIIGGPGDILNCHCSKCRRFHGHYAAYTGVRTEALIFLKKSSLKWFKSETDETPNVHRGFCRECGSSLFWHPRDLMKIWIAVGSLDICPKIPTLGHVWTSQKGDYYTIDDHLRQFEKGWPEEMDYNKTNQQLNGRYHNPI